MRRVGNAQSTADSHISRLISIWVEIMIYSSPEIDMLVQIVQCMPILVPDHLKKNPVSLLATPYVKNDKNKKKERKEKRKNVTVSQRMPRIILRRLGYLIH